MDKVEKGLKRLNKKERNLVRVILTKIKEKDFKGLDIKRLKKKNNIFRARKGNIRIIYQINRDKIIKVLSIEKRSEATYKF